MKNILPKFWHIFGATAIFILGISQSNAQTFPTPTGLTLPPGKTIVITYDVDVNADACSPGTVPPANLSNQATVSGSFTGSPKMTDDPAFPGATDPTLTPFAGLTIGNLVYNDVNRNGVFDAGDTGINGVMLNLYQDVNSNNMLDAGDGAAIASTTTANMSGQDGRYAFSICPGTYIVGVAASNFNMGGALYNMGVPYVSSPISGAGDPDTDLDDNDDNGDPVSGFGVATAAFTIAADNNNIDFGFKTPTGISIGDVTMNEGTGGTTTSFNFTVMRTSIEDAISLTVNTMAGTAASPGDYTAISGGTVSFTAGVSNTQTVTVLVNHDNIVEANETFTVVLSGAPPHANITDNSGLGAITNDDNATVTLSAAPSQNEGNMGSSNYTFTATLNNPVQGGFMIAYTTSNNSATAGSDYTLTAGSLTFMGNAGETQLIQVPVLGDMVVEQNETFTVALGTITGAPAGVTAGSSLMGTITNDDAATVSIAGSVSQLESQTPQAFSVTLSNPVDVNVTVRFNTANNTATTGDNDYTAIVNQLVTFNAGTTTSQTVNVTVNNDNKVETNEVFDVSIGSLMAGGRDVSLGTDATIGTILNDDQTILTLTAFDAVKNEGNTGTTPFIFRASLSDPVQGGFTIDYETSDGTATLADLDYVDNDSSLTFNGTASEFHDITVLVNGDNVPEANETFEVALTDFSLLQVDNSDILISFSPRTGTILNDEQDWGDAPDPTYPTLSASNGARHMIAPGGLRLGSAIDADANGQPNANATGDGADEDGVTLPTSFIVGLTSPITVNVSAACKLDAWIDWNRDGDWNDPGEQIFNTQSLVSGNNNLTVPVPVVPIGNSFARFRVSNTGGLAPIGAAPEGEVEDYEIQILDRAISVNDVMLVEGNAGMTLFNFTVSLNTPAGPGGVTFDIATQDNTATDANNDYEPKTLTGQSIPEGQSSYAFSVTVNGDNVVEGNETFFVNLTNVVGAGVADAQGTGTITNDDNTMLTLSQPAGASQNEGSAGTTPFVYRITLSNPVQDGFRVNYATNNGTATTADNDYVDNDSFLDFTGTAGEFHEFIVNVTGDTKVEPDETIQTEMVSLSLTSVNPVNVIFSGSPFTSTILNDDNATLTIAPVSQNEGTGGTTDFNFVVTLNNAVQGGFSLNFGVNDGTATDADDFDVITTNPIAFTGNPGEMHNIVVRVNADNKVEAHETFTVEMVSLSLVSVDPLDVTFSGSPATGTIQNDDAATVTLSAAASPLQFPEGNTGTTAFTFTATLNNPVQGGFMVAYTTDDGQATVADNDYVNNDGTLTFVGNAGETQPITVLVNGDLKVEINESFFVNLGAVTGIPAGVTTAGSPKQGLIVNDELDWGDAPDSYNTLSANNGARHNTSVAFHLGATVDGDLDGQPTGTANGDDIDAEGDDDDGVILPSALVISTTVDLVVNASGAGFLNAWVDFNNNGNWNDAGEQIFTNTPLVMGNNALSFAVPSGATPSSTFARFRYTTASVMPAAFTGLQTTGEVEDYQVNIVNTQFSIDDPVAIAEGNAGTTDLAFTVTRSNTANACSVEFSVTGGTATTGDGDFTLITSPPINFTAGGSPMASIIVRVNGDTKVELNETVEITLTNPVNGSILDGFGVGTINNDDAAVITVSSPTVTEGDAGSQIMTFDITMSNPSDANVAVNFATMNGTATTVDMDYQSTSGTHTFTPGQTMKQVMVMINGDCKIESNENFILRLSGLVNNGRAISLSGGGATLDGTGTINNNDAPPMITCPMPISIACDASTAPANTGTATATDNCSPQPTVGYSDMPIPGLCIGNSTIVRTWTATDNTGDMSSCMQTISLVDNTPPTAVCKTGTVVLDGNGNYTFVNNDVLNFGASSDNCSSVNVTGISPAMVTCAQYNQTVNVVVNVADACGNPAQCTAHITVAQGVSLPAGWTGANIGSDANGQSQFEPCTNGGSFSLSAQGYTTNTTDVEHTVYQTLCGDAEIIAHVTGLAPGAGWAGVQMRESASQGAKKFTLKTQLSTILRREIRTMTFGPTNTLQSLIPANHTWLRLVRSGSTFTAYSSADGVSWAFRSAASIAMTSCIQVGLFVESYNNTATTTATFNNVSISGTMPPIGLATPEQGQSATQAIPEIRIHPNPTNGLLSIDILGGTLPGNIRWTVFNSQGQAVLLQETEEGFEMQTIDLSAYADGVYWLRIQADGIAPVVHKVIKTAVVRP